MMILNESESPDILKVINLFYHPEKWVKGTETRYKLIKFWAKICEIVLEEYTEITGDQVNWAPGWVFSDGDCKMLACHTQARDECGKISLSFPRVGKDFIST